MLPFFHMFKKRPLLARDDAGAGGKSIVPSRKKGDVVSRHSLRGLLAQEFDFFQDPPKKNLGDKSKGFEIAQRTGSFLHLMDVHFGDNLAAMSNLNNVLRKLAVRTDIHSAFRTEVVGHFIHRQHYFGGGIETPLKKNISLAIGLIEEMGSADGRDREYYHEVYNYAKQALGEVAKNLRPDSKTAIGFAEQLTGIVERYPNEAGYKAASALVRIPGVRIIPNILKAVGIMEKAKGIRERERNMLLQDASNRIAPHISHLIKHSGQSRNLRSILDGIRAFVEQRKKLFPWEGLYEEISRKVERSGHAIARGKESNRVLNDALNKLDALIEKNESSRTLVGAQITGQIEIPEAIEVLERTIPNLFSRCTPKFQDEFARRIIAKYFEKYGNGYRSVFLGLIGVIRKSKRQTLNRNICIEIIDNLRKLEVPAKFSKIPERLPVYLTLFSTAVGNIKARDEQRQAFEELMKLSTDPTLSPILRTSVSHFVLDHIARINPNLFLSSSKKALPAKPDKLIE